MGEKKHKLSPSGRALITSIAILIEIAIIVYISTFFVASGEFVRSTDSFGKVIIDLNSYHTVDKSLPFWKFLLSPILQLGTSDGTQTLALFLFLILIAGCSAVLNKCGLIDYLIKKISNRFHKHKYVCMCLIVFIFMLLGSLFGTYQEIIPFIPILISLAISFGWNKIVGIEMSLVASTVGFGIAILNPFTIGIGQSMARISLFKGIAIRILIFILAYILICLFIYLYIRKNCKQNKVNLEEAAIVKDKAKDKSLMALVIVLIIGLSFTLCISIMPAFQKYSVFMMALTFVVASIICPLILNRSIKQISKDFILGVVAMLPCAIMILLASSIKYILVESYTLDTFLFKVLEFTKDKNPYFIFATLFIGVVILNIIIPSSGAKIFLLMPLVIPLTMITNLSLPLCVLTICLADGCSNAILPTNPVLIMGLNIAKTSYKTYTKNTIVLNLSLLALAFVSLSLAYLIGF